MLRAHVRRDNLRAPCSSCAFKKLLNQYWHLVMYVKYTRYELWVINAVMPVRHFILGLALTLQELESRWRFVHFSISRELSYSPHIVSDRESINFCLPFIIITTYRVSWYSFYHYTEVGRLVWPRHHLLGERIHAGSVESSTHDQGHRHHINDGANAPSKKYGGGFCRT